MLKKYFVIFIISSLTSMAFLNASGQGVYIVGKVLSIGSNASFGIHANLTLDSAVIMGNGNILMAKHGNQVIYSCQSEISNLVVTSNTTLNIIGPLKIHHYSKASQSQFINHAYLDTISIESDVNEPKKIEEKPAVEEEPSQSGGRPSSYTYFGLVGGTNMSMLSYIQVEPINHFYFVHNMLDFKIAHDIPPEAINF